MKDVFLSTEIEVQRLYLKNCCSISTHRFLIDEKTLRYFHRNLFQTHFLCRS